MKFTRVKRLGEMIEECGIPLILMNKFRGRIPSDLKYDDVFDVNYPEGVYEIKLDRYDIPESEIIEAMAEMGSVPVRSLDNSSLQLQSSLEEK